ncbi:hypothetical protein N3K66_000875 [Trichothecium roseum]|uniref:Uncharacterized protein n=1 Tax=Trichothecium roseum TaxID=47278 RepID=A0ACC0VD03_9HYPO|nr:hypothetical protein N3K66_000875 [Trichothecium roseum]
MEPDLVVGIDIGMSCTGVAYLNRSTGETEIKAFMDWGDGDDDTESKVPTRLTYRNGVLSQWGFQCQNDPNSRTREWFKTSLGKPNLSEDERISVHIQYVDFLTILYKKLKEHFSDGKLNGKIWNYTVIHFLFSIPAGWDPSISEQFRQLILSSGFQEGAHFNVKIDIKEPHATAVYTVKRQNIVKDLCLLEVLDAAQHSIKVSELSPTQGDDCGATMIDGAFEELVKNRLEDLKDVLTSSVEITCFEMRCSRDYKQNKYCDHVIISGGLGKSAYVFQRLVQHIQSSDAPPLLQGTQVHRSSDPQLCVCKGIVENAIQTINGEANTFQRRIADNSIGISCSVPYKSMTLFNGARKKMQGEAKVEHVVVEDSSGHRWIEGYMDCIDFEPHTPPSERIGWVKIKTCNSEPIPTLDKDGRVRDYDILRVDLSNVDGPDVEKVNRIGSVFGKKPFIRVHFRIVANIGMAEVTVQAVDRGLGRPLSGEARARIAFQTVTETEDEAVIRPIRRRD